MGVVISVLSAVLHRRTEPLGWRPSLAVGQRALFAVNLVPFVRYPANPPGVGYPATIDQRTHASVAAVVTGVVGVANRLRSGLNRRGSAEPARQLATAAVLVATVALAHSLPANPDAIDVKAKLLWRVRVLAVGTSLPLWTTPTVVFRISHSPRGAAHRGPEGRPRPRPVRSADELVEHQVGQEPDEQSVTADGGLAVVINRTSSSSVTTHERGDQNASTAGTRLKHDRAEQRPPDRQPGPIDRGRSKPSAAGDTGERRRQRHTREQGLNGKGDG